MGKGRGKGRKRVSVGLSPPLAAPEMKAAFEWLGWSPQKDSPVARALETHFPGAVPGSALTARLASVLRSHGVVPGNSILGTSICSDEINNEAGDMADQLRAYFGQVFTMGGIGGAPFVGRTGFHAFSHHVPDGGHVVVFFGPHVGISNAGEIGKYHRDGQRHESTACGAVSAAFQQCCEGKHGPSFFDAHDVQQSWLRDQIAPRVDEVVTARNTNAKLAMTAFDIIKASIEEVVHTKFGNGKLVLVGGIQINLGHPLEDHFMPTFFEIRQQGMDPVDLLKDLRLQ
ncbi:hypothetical protein CTAYLR_005319 [Chrysophaeum taylorii]|uniref:Limiting CO2-inducible protein B/C beta carbonyic anhydrase domain-containing protein n=1 Tax=Chrysophaeum taylorii TaxID=2483200 RepID=A0AAD7UJU9_9STRA|nr:hypothetical protein CTAYLR_005319 [Chrysophaeum taylorii]